MSSTGQIVGGVVGGVIGFYLGGPAGAVRGAAIGASIGGYIDPPPGPNLYGPTLDDKSFQSTAYGVSLATLHGSIATTGNIIYLENNEYKAVARKERTGGKGGGSQGSYTTTTYYATFAVALGEAMPGSKVRRIWLGGKLIFNAGTDDVATILQSASVAVSFRYYDGSQAEPDSRMESVVGVGRTPTYEGTAYIIFYDLDLTDYGNSLAGAPVKVEVVQAATDVTELLDSYEYRGNPDLADPVSTCAFLGGNSYVFTSSLFTDSVLTRISVLDPHEKKSSLVRHPSGLIGSLFGIPGSSSVSKFWCWYQVVGGTNFVNAAFNGDKTVNFNQIRSTYECVAEAADTGLFFVLRSSSGLLTLFAESGESVSLGAEPDDWLVAAGGGFVVFIASLSNTLLSVTLYAPDLVFVSDFTIVVDSGALVSPSANAAVVSGGYLYLVGHQFFGSDSSYVDIYHINLQSGILDKKSRVFLPAVDYEINPRFTTLAVIGQGVFIYGRRAGASQDSYTFWIVRTDLVEVAAVPLSDVVLQYIRHSGVPVSSVSLDQLDEQMIDGYRFSGPGSSRGALSPLQVAYLFDLVETGYTLTAVKRGAAADEVVPWQHLDARKTGDAPTVLIKRDYETDSQLPSRYSLTYLDYNREYDANTQYADFPSRRVNERNESVAIVMDAERAAQLADVLGNLAWMERNTFVFTVPQLYLGWRPGDVKTIELSPGNLATLRINNITYTEDQRLEINARLAEPAVYQSGAAGVPAQPPSEVIPFVGPSVAVLMDIPMILDSTDIPGFVGAMYGAGSWPGGVLFRSIDSGQTYTGIQAFTGQATIGEALNVLGSDDGLIIDRSSELTIQPLAGTFDAITEEQMLTGQHYCAYGVDGRWEIIRYADSVLNGDGTRTLSTLIRGYRGTEWATGLHEIGDYVVLLDDPDNAFIGSDLSQIAIERLCKPVTVGQDLASAESFEFTYQGVNLQPLSPVLPQGEIVSDDWLIEWTPRTRYSSNYWYTGTQPQNESVMAWEVDVLDGSSVVRTLSSSTPTVTYTEAQQIEDFGSAQSTLTIVIYQVSQRVGRGYPLEVTF